MKELTERKSKIVCALVDCYINTGAPVSSSDIKEKYMNDISTATIRAELATLEAMGYIEQPHTSAGRIPLREAYKLYVNNETCGKNVPAKVNNKLPLGTFTERIDMAEDISKEVAKIISDETNYTSFVMKNIDEVIVVEEVKLVPLKQNKLIIVISTNQGILSDSTLNIDIEGNQQIIDIATRVINNVFVGKAITSVTDIDCQIESEIDGVKEIFTGVLTMIENYLKENSSPLCVEGQLKLVENEAYKDIEETKKFLQVVSDKEALSGMLPAVVDNSEGNDDIEFSIKIGKEDNTIDKCAIVTAAYRIGDQVLGQAGVIGPERMDYRKVITVLNGLKTTFSALRHRGARKEIKAWLKDNKNK